MLLVLLFLSLTVNLVEGEVVCGLLDIDGTTIKQVETAANSDHKKNLANALTAVAKEVGVSGLAEILGVAIGASNPLGLIGLGSALALKAAITFAKIRSEIPLKPRAFERLMKILAIASPFQHKGNVRVVAKGARRFDMDSADPKTCGNTFPAASYPLLNFLCVKGEPSNNDGKIAIRPVSSIFESDPLFSKFSSLNTGTGAANQGFANYEGWWPALAKTATTKTSSKQVYTPSKLFRRYLAELGMKMRDVCHKIGGKGNGNPTMNELILFLWAPKALAEFKKITAPDLFCSLSTASNMGQCLNRLTTAATGARNQWSTAAYLAAGIKTGVRFAT